MPSTEPDNPLAMTKKSQGLLLNMKEGQNATLFFGEREDLKQVFQAEVSGDDLIVMRLEKLCKEFLSTLRQHYTIEIKMLSEKLGVEYTSSFGLK